MALTAPSDAGYGVQPPPFVTPDPSNFLLLEDFTQRYDVDRSKQALDPYNGQENLLLNMIEALGAVEYTISNDTHRWGEEGRLLSVYKAGVGSITGVTFTAATNTITIAPAAENSLRVGEVVQIADIVNDKQDYGRVESVTAGAVVVESMYAADIDITDGAAVVVTGHGSQFPKGSEAMEGSKSRDFVTYTNNFQIARENYKISGSDHSSAAWMMNKDGEYFWTNSDIEDTAKRFKIAQEIMMLNGDKVVAGSELAVSTPEISGSEGIFPAIRDRGNNFAGYPSSKTDLEAIIKRQDLVGGSPVMMMLLSRAADLASDNFYAQLSPTAAATSAANTVVPADNYGSFVNANNTMISLGFKGVEWGSYKWYKQAWSALTVPTSPFAPGNQSASKTINGMIMPYGKTPLMIGGETVKKDYLSLIYKAGNGQNRKFKTSLIDFDTDGGDNVKVNYLSEFMARTACANQFYMLEG